MRWSCCAEVFRHDDMGRVGVSDAIDEGFTSVLLVVGGEWGAGGVKPRNPVIWGGVYLKLGKIKLSPPYRNIDDSPENESQPKNDLLSIHHP